MFRFLHPATLAAFLALFAGSVSAPAQESKPVSFRRDLALLLHRRCATCHNEENAKGGYRLDTFAQLTKPGDSDLPPVVAGKPQEAELYRLLIEPDPHDRMPQKADALPPEEIALVERWIAEGAKFDGGAPDRPLVELAREALLRPAPERYARPMPVAALAFSPKGDQLAVAGYGEVTLWNIADGELVRRIGGLPERILSIAWSAKRNMLAIAGGSPAQWGTVALIDPRENFAVKFLCDLPETALTVAFSPDGTRLAAGAGDRTVRLFDVASGRETRVLRQHADWVQSVAFSPDGARLVSASRDRTARVSNVERGELETTYTGHDAALIGAVFSPTGSTVLSAARGSAVHQWEVSSGERKMEVKELTDLGALAMLRVGLLTAPAAGRVVRVHQLSDRQTLFTLLGHRDAVASFAVAPDGGTFASGSFDGEVCVWNLACGTWTQRFVASPGAQATEARGITAR